MTPYFSVITPSYNQGNFIGPCLQSVVDQGDADYEHLIFDNCSTDSTATVVSEFPNVKFFPEKDRGQSDAINRGFRAARGEIICWLNSDDTYPVGLFPRLRTIFSDESVEVVFGDVEQIGYNGSGSLRAAATFENRLDLVRWWSSKARLHQPAVFFRRAVMEATGYLREDLHYAMDYEYWWRMSENHRFHYLPEILAVQHRQPDSKTVLDWQKVYIEREMIFQPFYGLIDNGDPGSLGREKSRAMAAKYLGEAFALSGLNRVEAMKLLAKSFKENPAGILCPSWLGVLRRCLK